MKDVLHTRVTAMRRRPRLGDDGGEGWLITFADVVTLLLAFFVMIISVSEMNAGKIEALKEGLAETIGNREVKTPLKDIESGWQSVINARNLQDHTEVTIDDEGVFLEFNNISLYESGSATIQETALPLLNDVASIIQGNLGANYVVEIEGHTDDVPIHNEKYDSNWELSSNRATNIVKHFQSLGIDPGQMKASGYADSRPKTEDESLSIPERRALNRRIIIRVSRD